MAFNNARNFNINGGAHNVVHGHQINVNHITQSSTPSEFSIASSNQITYLSTTDEILRVLAARAAMNATSDAEARYPQPNCHPNTRVETLDELGQWVKEKKGTTRVCWVHGSAGVGKSAIAQKISEDHRSHVFATFFFSRNDSTRDNLEPFVATIAFQCCTSEALKRVVGPLIMDAIRSNPNIFDTSAENQFHKMILEPFSKVKWFSRRNLPNLLIVDGLDECVDNPSQQRLLEIIDLAITFRTPSPFTFLLCSRPEPQIRHGIKSAGFASCLKYIELSGTTVRFLGKLSESDLDIQRYFLEKFSELRAKYRAVLRDRGENWPSEAEIKVLVERASGQFIFAVTVINYVDTLDERPQDRLDTILSIEPGNIQNSPYPPLDSLYRQILSTCRDWDKIRPILQLLVTPHPTLRHAHNNHLSWNSPSIITGLFKLKPGEVEMLLSRLHSVVNVPDDAYSNIRILHASFTEFLLDSARSEQYCITRYSKTEYCDLVAVLLLSTLSSFTAMYTPYCTFEQPFGDMFGRWCTAATNRTRLEGISALTCLDYCLPIECPSPGLRVELDKFDPCSTSSMVMTIVNRDILKKFAVWRDCLAWAKSLEELIPHTFVERMEMFLDSCYIGFAQETLRQRVLRTTFEAECAFAGLSAFEADDVVAFATEYYQQWWTEGLKDGGFNPLLLPATADPGQIFPEDWVVLHATKGNGIMLRRVYDRCRLFNLQGRQVFDNDVTHDTTESLGYNLIKEEDLAAFKALIYERRDLLAEFPLWSPDSELPLEEDTIFAPEPENQRLSMRKSLLNSVRRLIDRSSV
ncbi:hypothetical protein VNI00_008806 [Paramarasmius palmivorus]|uniref:Nephrocystin 3-like N-terminal domain-containing protein n=1 Tax=Paramarasmius palmivorus TaxID=297713 RepID=A0AAW0CTC8_9AGAR